MLKYIGIIAAAGGAIATWLKVIRMVFGIRIIRHRYKMEAQKGRFEKVCTEQEIISSLHDTFGIKGLLPYPPNTGTEEDSFKILVINTLNLMKNASHGQFSMYKKEENVDDYIEKLAVPKRLVTDSDFIWNCKVDAYTLFAVSRVEGKELLTLLIAVLEKDATGESLHNLLVSIQTHGKDYAYIGRIINGTRNKIHQSSLGEEQELSLAEKVELDIMLSKWEQVYHNKWSSILTRDALAKGKLMFQRRNFKRGKKEICNIYPLLRKEAMLQDVES